jgi:hypothetical protein
VAYIPKKGSNGYGPQLGLSAEGYPVYAYADPHSTAMSYVVVLPDGTAFYSDAAGRIANPAHTEADAEVAGAILAGAVGALAGGPVTAIAAAIAGAIAGKIIKRQTA